MDLEVKEKRVRDTSKTNSRYLSREEIIEKLQSTQTNKMGLVKNVARLNCVIVRDLEQKAVELSENQIETINHIIQTTDENVINCFDEETP